MTNLNLDFGKVTGKIKPMHGVGQPPIIGLSSEMMHYIKEAGIPYSRLHDVGGAYGGNQFVDIPNIFRDFDADENDPRSYDFGFTDWLISELQKQECEPIYRLGVTIENYDHIGAYRIFPPKDYEKWARICEHIIRHYTSGWANGYLYRITYWEIWNEPENGAEAHNNQMWKGTAEEYFKLYEITAKHLKQCFPEIKVGGFASCGFWGLFKEGEPYYNADLSESLIIYSKNSWKQATDKENAYRMEFFDRFLAYVKDTGTPLDFFSWHSYDTIEHTYRMANYAERKLKQYGFNHTEHQLNEWSTARGKYEARGKGRYAAETLAMMCNLQRTNISLLAYYDARCGVSGYSGLFNPLTRKPFCTYYTFVLFNELFKLGQEVKSSLSEAPGIYTCAATNGEKCAFILVNTNIHPVMIETEIEGLPDIIPVIYRVDEEHVYDTISIDMSEEKLTVDGYTSLLFIYDKA